VNWDQMKPDVLWARLFGIGIWWIDILWQFFMLHFNFLYQNKWSNTV
jgi:hypothetical protein